MGLYSVESSGWAYTLLRAQGGLILSGDFEANTHVPISKESESEDGEDKEEDSQESQKTEDECKDLDHGVDYFLHGLPVPVCVCVCVCMCACVCACVCVCVCLNVQNTPVLYTVLAIPGMFEHLNKSEAVKSIDNNTNREHIVCDGRDVHKDEDIQNIQQDQL